MSIRPGSSVPSVISVEQMNEFLAASRCGGGAERRTADRHPFFAPISLRPCTSATQRWSAFSRDVSADGIGLLHNMAIDRGARCELTMKSERAELRQEAECMWCTSAGEGWYLSGWRFVSKS